MVPTDNNQHDYNDKMLEAFVNKPESLGWYKYAFNRFSVNGAEKISWAWSWWAFFGSVFYLLYRKAYMAALGLFFLSLIAGFIPFAGFILWIATGGLAPYFVYKVYLTKKADIEATIEDEQKRIETMREVGGYNDWAIWLAVALHAIFWISVFYMLFAMMPMLMEQQF